MRKILFLILVLSSCKKLDFSEDRYATNGIDCTASNLSRLKTVKEMKVGESGWASIWWIDEQTQVSHQCNHVAMALITKIRDNSYLSEVHGTYCDELLYEGYPCEDIKTFGK